MATRDGNEMTSVIVGNSGAKGRFVTVAGNEVFPLPGAGAITRYFKKRARDSGAEPAIEHVVWVTTDAEGSYPDAPPFGGPLVDEEILSTWVT